MKFLMCDPQHYDVNYIINPWMKPQTPIDTSLCIHQWNRLKQTIELCGAEVMVIEGDKRWPDMVFTANAGYVIHNAVILSYFKHQERQGETPIMKQWFESHGYNIISLPQDQGQHFEGEGDLCCSKETMFAGYGFRSDRACHKLIRSHLSTKNHLELQLIDPHFYHLDTCFCLLNDTLALRFPGAFDSTSNQLIEQHIECLDICEEEAHQFACNAVVIDRHVIVPGHCPKTQKLLEAHGFTTHSCDLSQFMLAGGAAKCLSLKL